MQTQTLYNGAVTIRRDGSHKYFVTDTERGLDDVWAPGVTGISGKLNTDGKLEGLNKWAALVAVEKIKGEWSRLISLPPSERNAALDEAATEHVKKRDKAAEIGTVIHAWVEAHIRALIEFGAEPAWPSDPVVASAVERYLEWERSDEIEYVFVERYVYNRTDDDERYVGQADIGVRRRGVKKLVDLKSSNYFSVDYVLQTAAYAHAYNVEFPDDPIRGRLILMVDDKEGRMGDPIDLGGEEELEYDYRGFLGCLAARNWEAGLKERKKQWGIGKR